MRYILLSSLVSEAQQRGTQLRVSSDVVHSASYIVSVKHTRCEAAMLPVTILSHATAVGSEQEELQVLLEDASSADLQDFVAQYE